MHAPVARRRSWRGLLVPALLAFAVLVALGSWQLHRKVWKEALIADLDARLAAQPEPLPVPQTWSTLDPKENEYQRVKFTAVFDNSKEALVYATASAFRPDAAGLGYWIFTPARVAAGGIVIVNRGFVPEGWKDPATRVAGEVSAPVEIVGVLRWPDARHWFTPPDDPSHNLWFARDPAAIASAEGLDAVAPFYVEQEEPAPPGGLPQPGKLVVRLPNNHLQYALTWFGLALALVAVFAALAVKSIREEGQQPDRGRSHSL